jgi:hypothetical protein
VSELVADLTRRHATAGTGGVGDDVPRYTGQVVDKVEGYGGQLALVDVEGAQRKVNIGMLEDQTLEPGDGC